MYQHILSGLIQQGTQHLRGGGAFRVSECGDPGQQAHAGDAGEACGTQDHDGWRGFGYGVGNGRLPDDGRRRWRKRRVKKTPEFVKERAIIIPLGRQDYVGIPIPLGLHVFPNIGRTIMEIDVHDDPTKSRMGHVLDMAVLALDAYNPLGGSADLGQIASPTWIWFDPALALARNKDWTGREIYREDRNSNDPTPGASRVKDSTRSPTVDWPALPMLQRAITNGGPGLSAHAGGHIVFGGAGHRWRGSRGEQGGGDGNVRIHWRGTGAPTRSFWQVASTGTRAAPTARATPTTRASSGSTSARTSSKPGFSAERMLMECWRMCRWPGLMAQRRLWTRRSRTFESSDECYRPRMSRTNANR